MIWVAVAAAAIFAASLIVWSDVARLLDRRVLGKRLATLSVFASGVGLGLALSTRF